MENLNLLWEYQQADLALANFEAQIKNTPTRKKLVKLQRFLQTAQAKLAEMENLSRVKQNQISELDVQNKALLEDLEDLNKDLGYYSECDDDELDEKEVRDLVKNSEKVYDSIVSVKKSISQIKQEIERDDKTAKELLQKMKAAKVEYDSLRAVHNKELAASKGDVDSMRARVLEMEKQVQPALIAEYKRIKGFRQNPVALLENSRCGGCNMQLPSGVAAQVTAAQKPVECENCGRILVIL